MMTLTEPDLGTILLRHRPFTVVSFQIGSRQTRQVRRGKALADGETDDTAYAGGRAVTLGLRISGTTCDDGETMQDKLDELLPFLAPRRRPVLTWSIPGATGDARSIVVRGDSAPIVVSQPKHIAVVASFVAADGEITSGDLLSTTLLAGTTGAEAGRTYPLTYPRTYSASAPIGSKIVNNPGNERAHWKALIYGGCTNPEIRVNGIDVKFNAGGGLVLTAPSYVEIDTKARTILLNSDPANPRYNLTNFPSWWWDDLLLKPGDNTMRLQTTSPDATCAALVTYKTTWAG